DRKLSIPVHELHLDPAGNDPRLRSPVEQQLYRGAAPRAVIHRPVVHIHPHEGVGALISDATVELLRVVERWPAMCQPVFDARAEIARDLVDGDRTEVAPYHVAAKREWKAGVTQPPRPHVLPQVQALVLEGEL